MSGNRKEYPVRAFPGKPDEEAWESAELLTDFSFPWLERAAPATEFRALWNPERFYFRFDVVDEEIVLDEREERPQRVLGSDRVELFFACDAEITQYYCMEMDPRGEVYDYAARSYRDFDPQWSCAGLKVGAVRREGGYRVEGSIPMGTFRELGIEGLEDGWMRAGAYRAEFSRGMEGEVIQDWISWIDPGTPTADFHVAASFGVFRLRE